MSNFPLGKKLDGEQIFREPDFSAGVFVPRIAPDDLGHVTASEAVLHRSAGRRPEPWQPGKGLSEEVLLSSGAKPVVGAEEVLLRDGEAARFFAMKALGMTAVFFADNDAKKRAIEQLADDYEFVQDFPLSLPSPAPASGDFRPEALVPTSPVLPEESGVAEAHKREVRGQHVLLGVLDSGVDADHREFAQKRVRFVYIPSRTLSGELQRRRGFDPNHHGTHVCGTLAGNNIGIAPEADLYVASVIESETLMTSFLRVLRGLDWLAGTFARSEHRRRPAVINLSLGFPPIPPPGIRQKQYKVYEKNLRYAVSSLHSANILVVSAIGNDGPDRFRLPAAYGDVMGVGAIDFDKKVAGFSGGGMVLSESKPNVVGYGVNVLSSYERNIDGQSLYHRMDGTSMASPYVAGIAALYRGKDPGAPVQDIVGKIAETALPIEGESVVRVGAGLARFVPES